MHKSGLTAAAALVAAALPFALATGAMAQNKAALAGGGGGVARAAPAAPAGGGGGMKAGMAGGAAIGGSFQGSKVDAAGPGLGGPRVGISPGGGKTAGMGPGPGTGVTPPGRGPRHGWHGRHDGHGYHHRHRHHRNWIWPTFGFGIGSVYAASPYYYDPYYYGDDYVDSRVYSAVGASPDEIAYCKRRFKSYDVRSGTYLGYDGERHPCP